MMILDRKGYENAARRAAAEGQVLLENRGRVLPLPQGTEVAVFGRIQFNYYKSGTGSGGMVNVDRVYGILEALQEAEGIRVNEKLLKHYEEWCRQHPFAAGVGWGTEPWSQEEMEIEEDLAREIAGETDTALVIIGRTAGEDRDNQDLPGAYRLTDIEERMLERVRSHFPKMIVLLNVGNIMDMGFVERYKPEAVLYAWQGGMLGGLGTADVLTGAVSPSGKLTDTIAKDISDYPSDKNFGNRDRDYYQEDIYVGYRYFETVAKDKVLYPFGYGLSYTEFEILPVYFQREDPAGKRDAAPEKNAAPAKNTAKQADPSDIGGGTVTLQIRVKNQGAFAGKEVVQVYVQPPCGTLGRPSLELAGFAKTEELKPGEEAVLRLVIPDRVIAAYDETGSSGYASAFVLEKGTYRFLAGNSVRDLAESGSFTLTDTVCIRQLTQAMAPALPFERMKAVEGDNGRKLVYEAAPLRTISPAMRRAGEIPADIPYIGDKGYRLADVKAGRITMEEFIAQLTDEDLAAIIRGEGMGSPKVTPGTAAAFGGISDHLKELGIPCGCCSDGPSGIRLDSGVKAFSLPNGTLLACTFNEKLVEELYGYTGIELVKNRIDALLGPGMNIHRHPLNGRNFEYFSEDPLVSGKIAAAMIRGLKSAGVTGTAKHFCGNNQETARHEIDCVISERALREIYLKGFEIAVREGGADTIMTTYGSVNGLWTAGNYDLNTEILRTEWGFKGLVMTDWRAAINEEGEAPSRTNFAAMARSQNDLYMVVTVAAENAEGDNTLEALERGTITRGELQRCAMNICGFLLGTHAMERMEGYIEEVRVEGAENTDEDDLGEVVYHKVKDEIVLDLEHIEQGRDKSYAFALDLERIGGYRVTITARSELSELAQMPITLFYQSVPFAVFTFFGTGGKWEEITKNVVLHNKYAVLKLSFGQNGLLAKEIKFTFDKSMEEIMAREQDI